MTKEKTLKELETILKALEFSQKWRVLNTLPFDDIIKHLNDYLDLLEGRVDNV